MNKQRRKDLADILKSLEELQENLDLLTDEEEEYRDNIPDNLIGSYEKADQSANNLREAVDLIGDAMDLISDAMDLISLAIEED